MAARMSPAWRSLSEELARWEEAGRTAEFWWRDDDAARPAPALARLLSLAERTRTPLALAVVPEQAEPGLFEGMGPMTSVIQHGCDHRNRAGAGEKKSEFPAGEPPREALARIGRARARLKAMAGARMVEVLAPPWNRIDPGLVPGLADAGLRGLSCYGARKSAFPAAGVRQVNTHADIIDWRGARAFLGEERTLALAISHLVKRREARADPGEATGWLTHHAGHDEAAWTFLERLFEFCARSTSARWRGAVELFT
jgi:hypothetical protein